MRKTAELIIDEFEKVVAIEKRAREALDAGDGGPEGAAARASAPRISQPSSEFMRRPHRRCATQRGQLITLQEMRYIDLAASTRSRPRSPRSSRRSARRASRSCSQEDAFGRSSTRSTRLVGAVEKLDKARRRSRRCAEELDVVQQGLDAARRGGRRPQHRRHHRAHADPRGITDAFAQLNRARATRRRRKQRARPRGGKAEFGAQFKLFGQTVAARSRCATRPSAATSSSRGCCVAARGARGPLRRARRVRRRARAASARRCSRRSARASSCSLDERQRRAAEPLERRRAHPRGRRAPRQASPTPTSSTPTSRPTRWSLKLRRHRRRAARSSATAVKADELAVEAQDRAPGRAARAARQGRARSRAAASVIKLGQHRFTSTRSRSS